jgi:PAS domain S-box-containing protein
MSERIPSILIVEDDQATRTMIARILRRLGYETEEADTGCEALQRARQRFFNVALLDIRLPDMRGLDLVTPLRDIHPDIAPIIVTGHASTQTAMSALNNGAAGYILKPVDFDELQVKLQDTLDKQRLLMEKREAEAALIASERRYRRLFEFSPSALWLEDFSDVKRCIDSLLAAKEIDARELHAYDREHPGEIETCMSQVHVIDVNEATLELYRASSKEELKTRLDEIFTEESRDAQIEALACLARGDTLFDVEIVNQTLTGERLHVITRWSVVPGHEETFGRVLLTSTDITERKETEEALRESEERLRTVIKNAPIILFALDAEGRITFAEGQGLYEGFPEGDDWTTEQIIGKPVTEVFGDAPGVTEDIQRALSGEAFTSISKIENAIFEVTYSPLAAKSASNEERGVIGVAINITERRRLQEQLRRRERLSAVGQLAAGIAHDFNNLLTTIMLYAHMPLNRPDLPEEVRQALRIIYSESESAADLIQQILDFSRQSKMDRAPVDLRSFIEESVNILKRTFPENIDVHLTLAGSDYAVNADPGRIQQALVNLLLNARDAIDEGGEIRVRLARVNLPPDDPRLMPEMDPGAWICLSVSDTGAGMSQETLQHLYEPFFTTKESGKGTGLGLPQVYGIVKQHAGFIDAQSEVGEGTTFYLYLPPVHMTDADSPESADEVTTPVVGHERILLVEDEPAVREAIGQVLEPLGYHLVIAQNGEEALALYEEQDAPVDLVITDLVMPKLGGRTLLRRLREKNPELKAIAITGYAPEEDQITSGLWDALLRKPFDTGRLGAVVRQVLDADS